MGGAQLEGADQLARSLENAADQLLELEAAARAAAALAAAKGTADAPRRTGYLASTVGYELVGAGFELVAAAPYAAIVHARRPWLEQTVAALADDITTIYADDVNRIVGTIQGV